MILDYRGRSSLSALVFGPDCTSITVRGIHILGDHNVDTPDATVGIVTRIGEAAHLANPGTRAIDLSYPDCTLNIEYCEFNGLNMGVHTGNYDSHLTVYARYSKFNDCGGAGGFAHGMYLTGNALVEVVGCTFVNTSNYGSGAGHLLKSRARTTHVYGSYFTAPINGQNCCIELPNGGNATVAGNLLIHNGFTNGSDENWCISFAREQNLGSGNWADDDRTHSALIAQNTTRKPNSPGYTQFEPLFLATPTDGGGTDITYTKTVQNNLWCNGDTAQALGRYPNNSAVSNGTVNDLGVYSGSAISGSPATNNATYSYAGEFIVPNTRTDTYRGGYLVNTAPAWATSIAVGEWGTMPNSRLDAVTGVLDTSGTGWIVGFSGGVVNTVGMYIGSSFVSGTFIIPWGGGHGSWPCNELYSYGPLESGSPTWQRVRDRVTETGALFTADGTPSAFHSYDALCYVASSNKMYSMGGLFNAPGASSTSSIFTYDFNQVSPNSNQPWAQTGHTVGIGVDTAVYDSAHSCIWYRGINDGAVARKYDFTSSTTSSVTPSATEDNYTISAVDTTNNLWLEVQVHSTATYVKSTTSLGAGFSSSTAPGNCHSVLYDPVGGYFIAWAGSNSKTLYKATWNGSSLTWTTISPGGAVTPGATDSTDSTFKRFNYVNLGSGVRGYTLMNMYDQSIYFYRAS
jgi:hypothetical protein